MNTDRHAHIFPKIVDYRPKILPRRTLWVFGTLPIFYACVRSVTSRDGAVLVAQWIPTNQTPMKDAIAAPNSSLKFEGWARLGRPFEDLNNPRQINGILGDFPATIQCLFYGHPHKFRPLLNK